MAPSQAREWVEVAGAAVIVLSQVVAIILALRGMKRNREKMGQLAERSHEEQWAKQMRLLDLYVGKFPTGEALLAELRSIASQASPGSNGIATETAPESSSAPAGETSPASELSASEDS